MNTSGLEVLDHSVQLAHEWVNDVDRATGWNDRHRSWRLLRAVLQTLRDCLPLAETAHLSAQLPIVLRGVYFEQWKPEGERIRHWDIDRFFAQIQAHFSRDPVEDLGDAVEAVFGVLEARISEGEIRHIVGCLPTELTALWAVA